MCTVVRGPFVDQAQRSPMSTSGLTHRQSTAALEEKRYS
jgi:hypothetical protein